MPPSFHAFNSGLAQRLLTLRCERVSISPLHVKELLSPLQSSSPQSCPLTGALSTWLSFHKASRTFGSVEAGMGCLFLSAHSLVN